MIGNSARGRLVAVLAVLICLGSATSASASALVSSRDLPVSPTGLYIIQLDEPAIASYSGEVAGIPAINRQVTGASRLDSRSSAVEAYADYLFQRQNEFSTGMQRTLGRSVEIPYRYDAALNGLAVRVSHAEALRLKTLPGVRAVFADLERELETDVGPGHIGAPDIWSGLTGSGIATRGEGVIIGVLDTGINSQHPAFAEVDGDSYVHFNPYGAGVYGGWCETNAGFCNEKLIAAYTFHQNGGSPEDINGHGSHTASTAAGNRHVAEFDVGIESYSITLQGVAPRANLVAYKVCDPSCPTAAIIAAVNSAIMNDDVDIINYSISGVDNPWNDAIDLAFLEAFAAGIFIAASAGNSGPNPSTVAKTGPWNASVAASSINRVIAHTLDVIAPTTPSALQSIPSIPGEGTNILTDIVSGIRYDAGNNLGCSPFAVGTFTGNLALIQRGQCPFQTKVTNAVNAGATGVALFQNFAGPPIAAGGLTGTPPTIMLDRESGLALRDYVVANPTTAEVRINAANALIHDDQWEDIMGGFSARGPSQFELLAPTFTAPGVNILAAVHSVGGDPAKYGFQQGTSMAAPHAAGAAALLKALNPGWSPSEIRSALAMTANPANLLKENGSVEADLFDVGSGLLDLDAAGRIGLVMDESYANFVAANPAAGGDPKTLNLPALIDYICPGECSWTRTFTSVAADTLTYEAQIDAPPGMTVIVDPPSFTIAPGESRTLTITADVEGMPLGNFAMADVRLVGPISETEFVEVGEAYDLSGTWTQKTHDISAYAGQEVCLAYRFEGSDTHAWYIDDIVVSSGSGTHINESFGGETFPPAGWSAYQLGTTPQRQWARTTASFNSTPAAAWHNWNGAAFHDDSWLVTPRFTLGNNPQLTYFDRMTFISFYRYSGVWISTGECDPRELELAPSLHLPIAVIPAISAPVISIDPIEIVTSQFPEQITTRSLTIANSGGVDLNWTVSEVPLGTALELSLDASRSDVSLSGADFPISFALDDGVGEDAVGLTGGGSFIWLNRFTPEVYSFPIMIERVDIMFGYPGSTGGVSPGELVDIYLFEDADGNPANGATHVGSLTGQAVQAVNGTDWSTYHLAAPVTFDGPGDILIAVVNRTAGQTSGTFPAVIDQTPPSQARSWVGFGEEPGDPPVLPLPTFGVIDSFGIAGNWMVRGFGIQTLPCDAPGDVAWMSFSPASGTTLPLENSEIELTIDSSDLEVGNYSALLCIDSNDPDRPTAGVPITLDVVSGNVFRDRFEAD